MYGHGVCDEASQSAINSERGAEQAHNQTGLYTSRSSFVCLHLTQRLGHKERGEICHSGENGRSRARHATGQWWCQWLSLTLG